jgi:SWI/SNF-related matrix-associated actin-dependent regulator of chromatin subfamily A member 5
MDLQAQDRAHRIGQTKEVTVFRLITEGTIEEKIVERAEKKLYLDAVVVQQGRLQQQNAALSKNELMTMVKFGAEAIFRSGGRKISDDDIDAILERDSKRTQETRERFKTDVQHNLLNFKLDSVDESAVLLTPDPQAQSGAGSNFINLPSRTARSGLRREVETEESNQPAKPRGMAMHDFQFFDQAKIRVIEEQEHEFSMRRKTQMTLIREAKAREKKERGTTGNDDDNGQPINQDGSTLESEKLTQEMNEMYIPQELADEKQRFVSQGFQNWQRKDFRIYIAALERFGRDATDDIVNTVAEQTQKEKDDVLKYHKVFWQRYKEVEGWDKIIEKIEKGEQKIKRRAEITELLKRKVGAFKNPHQTLQIEYGTTKGKVFTEDEDRFLVVQMHRLGFGNWEQIRQEIRKSWLFRFDWFFKSRSAEEIKRRCEVLIRMIEKEFEEEPATNAGGAGTGAGEKSGPGRKRRAAEVTPVAEDDEQPAPRKRGQQSKE